MYQDNITLCGASAYEKKFYFNQDFNALPDHVKKELQIMCVLYTEDVGGILTLEFDENGRLQFKTEALEADARYDEIGSGLKIKQLQQDKKELLESLEMYYKVFFLGDIPEEELKKIDDPRVKILAFAEVSNVLGIDFDPKPLIQRAHAHGAVVVLDGAQSTPHKRVDVQDLDCDFFAFSGHKMCSMGGIGVLYGKEELLNDMEPFLMGGDMIDEVQEQKTTFADLPAKFEAGTQYVEGAVSLVDAIKYVESVGYDEIRAQERRLVTRCLEGMKKLPFIHIIGPTNPEEKEGLVAF